MSQPRARGDVKRATYETTSWDGNKHKKLTFKDMRLLGSCTGIALPAH